MGHGFSCEKLEGRGGTRFLWRNLRPRTFRRSDIVLSETVLFQATEALARVTFLWRHGASSPASLNRAKIKNGQGSADVPGPFDHPSHTCRCGPCFGRIKTLESDLRFEDVSEKSFVAMTAKHAREQAREGLQQCQVLSQHVRGH